VPRICFQGVDRASPFGVLLTTSVSARATVCGQNHAELAPEHWMATVYGSSLQWWGTGQRARASTPSQDSADIVLDVFGNDVGGIAARRVWRVVDESGEPILNPYCFLAQCCRAPFVASIFLIECARSDQPWMVIGEAHVSNCRPYRELLNRVAQVTAHLVACALRKNGRARAKPWNITPRRPSRSRAGVAAEQLRARASKAAMTLRHAAFDERWAIGTLRAPLDVLTHSQVLHADSWIRSPSRAAYLADPFPWPGRSNVFLCERYDYRSHLGTLRAVRLAEEKVANEQAVDLNVGKAHVSYPFMYRQDGRVFLLPEMAAFQELLLFELISETDARVVCVVDRGTRIADPTLFLYHGLYWIAYTDLGLGTDDNLCLLYSSQLAGPWLRHPLNPVKIDIRSSRPGGTPFFVDGKLYRPAQDCSTTYGASLAVNLVRVCTPNNYEEERVAVLAPDLHGPFPHGLHTLSSDGSRILFDGKKLFFDPSRLSTWMKARFRRARVAE
jgi:hypothetical protein